MTHDGGIIGVADHGGWAVLVAAAGDGTFLDCRRRNRWMRLPQIPHHGEAQRMPIGEAVALVERLRPSAEQHATRELNALDAALPGRIRGVALRECPVLPPDGGRVHHGLPGAERGGLGNVPASDCCGGQCAWMGRALV
jgi:hypothetical protein